MTQRETVRRGRTPGRTLLFLLLAALGTLAVIGGSASAAPSPGGDEVAAAVAFVPSEHVSLTLEGCRNDGTIILPIAGKFVCPDPPYTTGNLGKGWNELDLVPHRLTTQVGNQASATTDYGVSIAADYQRSGRIGYDVISVPVVNTAKSHASCQLVDGGTQSTLGTVDDPFGGGTDVVIYRTLAIHQNKGTTCVFDYHERLALGSHLYPGASLQSYLATTSDLSGSKKTVSIPVNEIEPQQLSKDMTATQGSDHVWDITKSPSPASLSFPNTCDPSNPASQGVELKITWTKGPATASGPITVITHVYATNPAARVITIQGSDAIRSGTTVLDTAPFGPTNVPANTTDFLVLTHQTEVPAGTANLNDVATATYTDLVTQIPIPGSTTATASAPVQVSGPELNQTATINDIESITGSGLKFSTDSVSGASGAFDSGYIAGTQTVGPVSWTSDSQSGSGSVTFGKTVYAATGSIEPNGQLSDTATLTGSNGFSASAPATVSISADAKASLTIDKTISNVLQGSETATFTFHVKATNDVNAADVASTSISFSAGETNKNAVVSNLTPGVYYVFEDTATGWQPNPDGVKVDLSGSNCSGTASFTNAFNPAAAKAVKVTNPVGSESGWEMILSGPGAPAGGEKVSTDGSGNAAFTTALQEGSYTITETVKAGWDQTGTSGDCSFTVDYPADSGKTFTCTITNTQRGKIVVKKITDPSTATQKFSFAGDLAGDIGNGGELSKEVVPGDYSTTETVPAGWDLTKIECSDANSSGVLATGIASYKIEAGETVTCTYTNTQRGSIKVVKVTEPADSSETFSFSGELTGSIGNGESIPASGGKEVKPGTYYVTEAAKTGWDLTKIECSDADSSGVLTTGKTTYKVAPGENVTCTYTNRQRGKAKVVKTVNGAAPSGTQAFTFQLRQNASAIAGGTTLESGVANAANGGVINFTTNLVPGETYQLCEIVMPGWSTTLGTFVPGSFIPPDGVAADPNVDNSILCGNFTVQPGETKTFTVDNSPPPGGRALTIGFWKNWASCTSSSTNKKPVLDQSLAKANVIPDGKGLPGIVVSATSGVFDLFGPTYYLVIHGSTATPDKAPDCSYAVNLVNKSTRDGKKKMASDPAFNMAAQLIAAELNYAAGAGKQPAVTTYITRAVLLLGKYQFNGLTHTTISSADTATMNCLAGALDDYNNNRTVRVCA
jgi:Prealbumin-like fold domain